ncbi:MAG: phosphate transport system permease protein [Verrucomicrobiales bacterium]|jgi:phosphate transport system permease protein
MFRFSRDQTLVFVLRVLAGLAGIITVFVAVFLVLESIPALRNVGLFRFFSDPSWHPREHASEGTFNLIPMIAGTLIVTFGAVLIATPFGIGAAIFCHFYAPRPIASAYRRIIELLAGIPSVVYGFWGLVVLVPFINSFHPPGQSVLAAVLILAIMILPTAALVTDAAIAAVPQQMLNGAASLGLSRWGTIRGVVLPSAKSGVFTGIILQTGRAIGETLAVLMVCGNIARIPGTPFEPVRTLTTNIALEMAYSLGDHRAALFVTGLLLLGMIVILTIAAEIISKDHVYDPG